MVGIPVEALLVPSVVTGLLGFLAAALKVYEYYHHNGDSVRQIDMLMWVAVSARLALGLIYTFAEVGVISPRTVEIRFCLTLLLLVEVLRGVRKIVIRRNSRKTLRQFMNLGWPDHEH